METYLDVCITKCPSCKAVYADASWYAINLSADLECGKCRTSFNAKENCIDRVMVKFTLDENGKVESAHISKLEE